MFCDSPVFLVTLSIEGLCIIHELFLGVSREGFELTPILCEFDRGTLMFGSDINLVKGRCEDKVFGTGLIHSI